MHSESLHSIYLFIFYGVWGIFQERDPSEGPEPRLDTYLCMLLCITTLAVAEIIEEDESKLIDETEQSINNHRKEDTAGKRRKDLVTSLQLLGDFEGLLTPPQSVSSVANQAAAKAIMFISGPTVGSGYTECMGTNDMPMNCCKSLQP